MFSYYGGKGRIAGWYPEPKFDLVIEPFAGAAWYSVRHQLGKKALLYDTNPIIADTWRWLIDEATEEDIFTAPSQLVKQRMHRFDNAGKDYFYRFWGNQGSEKPRNVAGKFHKFHTHQWRSHMAQKISGVKNWEFHFSSYTTIPNQEATWFIDPPYSQQSRYKCLPIDYLAVSEWCQSRKGQVIVCESEGATWLPFVPLHPGHKVGQRKTSQLRSEVVWTNS